MEIMSQLLELDCYLFNKKLKLFIINVFSDKPHNPLVNSGAIMSAALLLHLAKPELEGMANKYDFVFDSFKVSNCYNLAMKK